MINTRIAGTTRVLGREQGYTGLHVRDELIAEAVGGPQTPCMTTAWEPTPDELARLTDGAPVRVRILGQAHPPIIVDVGEPPAPSEADAPGTIKGIAKWRFAAVYRALAGLTLTEGTIALFTTLSELADQYGPGRQAAWQGIRLAIEAEQAKKYQTWRCRADGCGKPFEYPAGYSPAHCPHCRSRELICPHGHAPGACSECGL